MKTYLVQVWNKDGTLSSSYETDLPNAVEVQKLRKFLKAKAGHVLVTPQPAKPAKRSK